MPTYFPTDPTARVSFWENQVEHTITSDGLEIAASHLADGFVEQGVLRVGKGTKDTPQAEVYDPANDESLAYAASLEAASQVAPAPVPETDPVQVVASESASTSGDESASQPQGPDASQQEKRT